MQRAMIKCNGVQTQVVTEGRWIEEGLSPNGNKHVVLVIPGNPGIPDFYENFIKTLNSRLPLETPVWLVGHAGHVQPSDDLAIAMPSNSCWDEYYGLMAQLQHKKDFVKKYVPEDAKLHIVGHSIGCWFTLNLLHDESISDRVVKCYMLFPTIERMAQSRNGRFFTNVVARFASILLFLAWIFTLFPLFLQVFLIRVFGIFYGIPFVWKFRLTHKLTICGTCKLCLQEFKMYVVHPNGKFGSSRHYSVDATNGPDILRIKPEFDTVVQFRAVPFGFVFCGWKGGGLLYLCGSNCTVVIRVFYCVIVCLLCV